MAKKYEKCHDLGNSPESCRNSCRRTPKMPVPTITTILSASVLHVTLFSSELLTYLALFH